jgi:hypothetical protein
MPACNAWRARLIAAAAQNTSDCGWRGPHEHIDHRVELHGPAHLEHDIVLMEHSLGGHALSCTDVGSLGAWLALKYMY